MSSVNQFIDNRIRRLEISENIFIRNVARHLLKAIYEHPNGFTYDLNEMALKSIFSIDIYLVGQGGHGQVYDKAPKLLDIVTWLDNNLEALYRTGAFAGGWKNSLKLFHLDVIGTVTGHDNAMIAGQMNNEQEIYHPYAQKSLKVIPLSALPSIQLIRINTNSKKKLRAIEARPPVLFNVTILTPILRSDLCQTGNNHRQHS